MNHADSSLPAARIPFSACLALLACFFFFSSKGRCETIPQARQGVMDLSGRDFAKDGVVSLEGEWEFYWKRLLGPEDFAEGKPPVQPGHISLPGVWNGHRIDGKKLGAMGFATFRLLLETGGSERLLTLNVPVMLTAYRLWVNGKEVAANGVVGKSREESSARWLPMTVSFPPKDGENEFILQVSNFDFYEGGTRKSIELGIEEEMVAARTIPLVFLMLVVGALLIIGWYHVGLFILRRKERSSLYFGLASLTGVLQALGIEGQPISVIFPSVQWETVFRATSAAAYASMAFYVLFLDSLFTGAGYKGITKAFLFLGMGFALITLVTPAYIGSFGFYLHLPVLAGAVVYIVSILFRAAMMKKEGALPALGGVTFFAASVAWDALPSGDPNQLGYPAYLGNFALVCTLALILARRFSRAFSTIERQEAELEKANVELESRVAERTARLERSMREKEALLREIHHRVKNNMQVIVSLLNLQSDEVGDERARRLLRESRNRINSMMAIHEKLYGSENLAGIDFERYIKSIASDIFSTYGVEKERVDFRLNASGAELDLDRAVPCGLIINELLSNALKYAFVDNEGGRIGVSLMKDGKGNYELTVSDSGPGLPEGFAIDNASSLGLRLVKGLAERQLQGELRITNDNGARVTIRFS